MKKRKSIPVKIHVLRFHNAWTRDIIAKPIAITKAVELPISTQRIAVQYSVDGVGIAVFIKIAATANIALYRLTRYSILETLHRTAQKNLTLSSIVITKSHTTKVRNATASRFALVCAP